MDKGTKQDKEVKLTDSEFRPTGKIRVSPEKLGELRKIIEELDTEFKEKSALIDKRLKSFWADKTHSELILWNLQSDYENFRNIFTIFYAIDFLETRLSNVETILNGIAEKINVDLSNLKSEVKTLKKTFEKQEFAEVVQFVHHVKDMMKKSKRATDKYVE